MNDIAEFVRNRGVKFTSSDSETELYMSKYKKLDHTSNGNVARSTLEIPSLNEVEERKNAALNSENESNLAALLNIVCHKNVFQNGYFIEHNSQHNTRSTFFNQLASAYFIQIKAIIESRQPAYLNTFILTLDRDRGMS
jgi:hypothetical protein